jgi:hypothetical protein
LQEGFDGEAWKITPSSSMTERAKLERMCCFCSLAGSSAAPKTCLTVSQDHRDSSVKIAAIRQQRVVRTASLLGNVERRQDAREDGRCIKVMEIALASNLLPFHRSMRETFQFDSGALGSACYGPVGRSCPIVDADCVFSRVDRLIR